MDPKWTAPERGLVKSYRGDLECSLEIGECHTGGPTNLIGGVAGIRGRKFTIGRYLRDSSGTSNEALREIS